MAGKLGRRSGRRRTAQKDVVVFRQVFFSDGETEIPIDSDEELFAALARLLGK